MSGVIRKDFLIRLIIIHFITIVLIFLCGCTRDKESIDINLQKGQRIENIESGWWIKELSLNYDNGDDLTRLIHERIPKIGKIEYSYEAKKGLIIRKWKLNGKSQVFKIDEHIVGTDGGIDYYYEISLPPDSVKFSYLIGEMALQLRPGQYEKGAVYIKSKLDRARLILYGDGVYCKKMVLISGG
jgi:hypothetical protein